MTTTSERNADADLCVHTNTPRLLAVMACAICVIGCPTTTYADLNVCRANYQVCVQVQGVMLKSCAQSALVGISDGNARAAVEQCLNSGDKVGSCVRLAMKPLKENNPAMHSNLLQCASTVKTNIGQCRAAFINCRGQVKQ